MTAAETTIAETTALVLRVAAVPRRGAPVERGPVGPAAAAMVEQPYADADAALAGIATTPWRVLLLRDLLRSHVSVYRFSSAEYLNIPIAGTAAPVPLALASVHPSGYVRESALDRIARLPTPPRALVPFLVLGTTDHVPQVREVARAALTAALFADGSARHDSLRAALPMTLALRGRSRGGFALAQLRAATAALPAAELESLLSSRTLPPTERRLLAEQAARLPLDALVRLAEST